MANKQFDDLFSGENLIARITTDGNLDSSFGDNGFATDTFSPPITLLGQEVEQFALRDLIVDDNDRILTFSFSRFVENLRAPIFETLGTLIVRLDESGNVDRSFNNVGYTIVEEFDNVRFAGFDNNGDVVVHGGFFFVAKFNSV